MKDIAVVGLPSAIMQGIGFMVTGYNLILAGYGMTAVAVFGVYFKVQSFILCRFWAWTGSNAHFWVIMAELQNAKRF